MRYLYLLGLFLLMSCEYSSTKTLQEEFRLAGNTMGTSYHITYLGTRIIQINQSVDSLLKSVNAQVSTYIDTSIISRFNRPISHFNLLDFKEEFPDTAVHFRRNYREAMNVFVKTKGYFDPTVMPLVNYWGFGYAKKNERVDSSSVEALRALVGMDKITTKDQVVFEKKQAKIQLDFSALAKGYGVDAVADLLEERGVSNYMVEIGGELRIKGLNKRGFPWVIGINRPDEGGGLNEASLLIGIADCALATSGNYRNYYIQEGRKFVHTINPKTGYTEQNHLLSASVVANRCILADAYATACMVMGVEEAKIFLRNDPTLEGCLIYSLENGRDSIWMTDGFSKMVLSKND